MKKIFSALFIMVLAFAVVSCKPKLDPAEAFLDDAVTMLDGVIRDPKKIDNNFSLPTVFRDGVTVTYVSSEPGVLAIGEVGADGLIPVTVNRPAFEDGDADITLTATLTVKASKGDKNLTREWNKDLTVIKLAKIEVDEVYTSFKKAYDDVISGKLALVGTTFRTSLIEFEGVSLHGTTTGGHFVKTQDGSVAYIHLKNNVPTEGKLYNGTAKVYNYFGFLQLDDVNLTEVTGTPTEGKTVYEDQTIKGINELPKLGKDLPDMSGPNTYKLKNVKIYVDPTLAGTGSDYSVVLVDKDFNPATAERNAAGGYFKDSVLLYYTSNDFAQIKALNGLEIKEVNVIYEGYRDDRHVKYVTILNFDDVEMAAKLTDEDYVNMDLATLQVETDFKANGDIVLPTAGENGTEISWSFKDADNANNSLINLETGKVTIPTTGRVEVEIVAEVKKGASAEEKTFKIFIGQFELDTISNALKLNKKEMIMVQGIITDKFANNTYGMQDETGASIAIYHFGELTLGNIYTIIGEKDEFNGLPQLRNIEVVNSGLSLKPEAFSIDTIIGNNEELAKHIGRLISIEGAKVTVAGKADANGHITVKVIKGATELEIRYRAEVKGADITQLDLEVGDIINYVGVLGWFKGPQLGFGPNTYVGTEWPKKQEVSKVPYTIDFGEVAVTGYDNKPVTFTNVDDKVITLNKDRAQINLSTYAPHTNEGALLVLAPTSKAKESYVEFDLGLYAELTKISFSIAAWNENNIESIKGLEDSFVGLEIWDGSKWVSASDTNILSTLTKGKYTTSEFTVSGPGKYRVVYNTPNNTKTGNTDHAITINKVIFE